jgi:hypothetical protein
MPERSLALGLTIAFVLFVSATFGIAALSQSQPNLEVDVVDVDDPNETGRVTDITVKVRNTGDRPVDPVFSVIGKAENNYIWASNVSEIPANSAVTTKLRVKFIQQAIPQDTSLRVRVSDRKNSAQKAVSGLYPNTVCEPSLRDTGFEYWLFDNKYGDVRPALWSLDVWEPGFEPDGSFNTGPGPGNESAKIAITVPDRESGSWSQGSYGQTVTKPPERLTVEFANYSDSTVWRGDQRTGLPAKFVGVRFVDPANSKRIWVGYSENVDSRTVVRINGDVDYVIILTPETETTISPATIYQRNDWQSADQYDIRATVAAWPPTENTEVVGGFKRVSAGGC